jgi:hypothetical protein
MDACASDHEEVRMPTPTARRRPVTRAHRVPAVEFRLERWAQYHVTADDPFDLVQVRDDDVIGVMQGAQRELFRLRADGTIVVMMVADNAAHVRVR